MNIRQTTVGPMGVYAYIISCPETKEAAFIDPAGDEDRLVREAEAAELKIKYILNTHGHCDHIGGNARIKELTGAEIIVGKPDEPFFGPGYAERCRSMGFPPSPPADKFVNDGDEIVIGQEKLTVLATPGHTPGGVCYYRPGHVFTGDTLFVNSVGRTDLPGGDGETMFRAIGEKLMTLPEETVVWPGHAYGPKASSTIGAEKRSNPYVRQYVKLG